jgi:hypothetical protein
VEWSIAFAARGGRRPARYQQMFRARTNPWFARYRGARVDDPEVAMPLMYLPLIISSATMLLYFDAARRK